MNQTYAVPTGGMGQAGHAAGQRVSGLQTQAAPPAHSVGNALAGIEGTLKGLLVLHRRLETLSCHMLGPRPTRDLDGPQPGNGDVQQGPSIVAHVEGIQRRMQTYVSACHDELTDINAGLGLDDNK